MRPLVVLRPEPGATATIAAARAIGLEAIAAPLFAIRALAWQLPDTLPDAVLMTSANAARFGGEHLAALAALPLYAVGAATATAARAAGFARIVTGDGDGDAIVARARDDRVATLLHLAGREHRAPGVAAPVVTRRIVYAADEVAIAPPLPSGSVVLLHSPRAAALFARLTTGRADTAVVAISPSALAAAGGGWRATAIAARPDDPALLAAAAKLCDQ